jgi:hypothetical protein
MAVSLEYNKDAREQALQSALLYLSTHTVDRKGNIIIVINMAEPSYRERMYVYDMSLHKFIRNMHVAHGSGSSNPKNLCYANKFSNQDSSHCTSLGGMLTTKPYTGKHGYSMRLKGLDKGVNDNVMGRGIVIHRADYVNANYITRSGRAGQSWGCPAISDDDYKFLMPLLIEGIFIYTFYQ